ncbi:FAD-dependent oxidoreductase [Acetobacterium paludosum]|uniref:FAD-dependent oxidoreductase n=2 Tax=Acetobacterium paludosum TaxID=52693 RepID=A0A923I2Z0_9FIRM|nr:FAD-dependent oxidoreductase [Acetobacterium paludosum]
MKYDVIIIGAGISGLTAASLLSKRGLKVVVIDKSYNPGGSCGIFKRNNVVFDQGAAMLFGFGEKGFNAHRFVFNCLEEPFDVIKHDLLYCVNFKGNKIKFWPDIDQFIEELSKVFPAEKDNIKRFYKDLEKMYQHVMVENPSYSTPDETDPKGSVKSFLKHPGSYLRFLSYLNKSAGSLLAKYFSDPEIFKFFDKLTSTYCYTTVEESPAVLAAVMFVDNHIGGSYYPAGSTLFLPGTLEKVIEENGGEMLLEKEVTQILFHDDNPVGVELKNGEKIYGENLIYSGTVWNLYGKLIDQSHTTDKKVVWAENQIPTYPSVVFYAYIDKNVIPEDTAPVEMLVGNPDSLDESEVTVYLSSIDDKTLCDAKHHVLLAIGPTFESWDSDNETEYLQKKEKEKERLIAVLEKKFVGFRDGIDYAELATPRTIERYTNKNGGAVAGPKQMLGQHMFNRLHTRSEWNNLFYCGESTVMGTGTPTVTTSGLSAANAVLKKMALETFVYHDKMKNYVSIRDKPFTEDQLYREYSEEKRIMMNKARACQYCEKPGCAKAMSVDIRGMMRRVTVGNFVGAKKIADRIFAENDQQAVSLSECEKSCIKNENNGTPVEIQAVFDYLRR